MGQFQAWAATAASVVRNLIVLVLLAVIAAGIVSLIGGPNLLRRAFTITDLGWLAGVLYGVARSA